MIQIDDLLEQVRRQLSRYSLIESLFVVFGHMQYLQFNRAVPDSIQLDPAVAAASGYDRHFYEWELDLLSRELLQHAPLTGQFSLTRWSEFASTLNLFKDVDNTISERAGRLLGENILLELGRLAYREFPWQERPNQWRLTRYYKIFGDAAVDAIIEAEIGLTAKELYILGLALTGHFITHFAYDYSADFSAIGITDEKRRRFMRHFSRPLSELSKMAKVSELRDVNFVYSQNPLRIFPIVHAGVDGRHCLIAPIPSYLFHRFTAGVYYELTDNPRFGNAFGDSFQRYIGEVLTAALLNGRFEVHAEQEYYAGKDRKDTIDWIASDDSAHLFVECKTKRMQLSSRIALADTKSLDADLAKIADFIFQAYKTIEDAKSSRYPHWHPDDRPIYPVVVLLEDWYLFDPRLEASLDQQVIEKLRAAGIDPAAMTAAPYSVCTVGDFEILVQVIAMTSIAQVMQKKLTGESTKWNMKSFLQSDFANQVGRINKRGLFPHVLESIHPAIRMHEGMPPDIREPP